MVGDDVGGELGGVEGFDDDSVAYREVNGSLSDKARLALGCGDGLRIDGLVRGEGAPAM